MRGRISVLLAVMLMAACASTQPAASPGQSAPIPTVDPNARADPGLVDRFKAEGLGEGEAIFAALTRTDVEQLTPLSYRVTQSYPTGNSADLTVILTPDQTADPAAPMIATYTDTGGDFGFRLEYFIAYDDMPDDVEAEIRGTSAHVHAPIAMAGTGLTAIALTAAQKSGVRVVVEGLVKEFRDAAVSLFVEALDAALGAKAVADSLYNAIKAGLSFKEALALGQEHDRLKAIIDKLEECAKNPTNPVTKRAYQTDPAQKQKILDTIAEARLEIKSNVAVMFVGMINSTGSGLAGSKVLGFVIGPATAYVEQELKKLNDAWIKVLDDLITDCEAYQFEMSGALASTLAGESGELIAYHYWGVLCDRSEPWKVWESYDGSHMSVEGGPPDVDPYPYQVTFDSNGSMTRVSVIGQELSTTAAGTTFRLSPGDKPTTVTATIPTGAVDQAVSAPVRSADGTIAGCENAGQ